MLTGYRVMSMCGKRQREERPVFDFAPTAGKDAHFSNDQETLDTAATVTKNIITASSNSHSCFESWSFDSRFLLRVLHILGAYFSVYIQ